VRHRTGYRPFVGLEGRNPRDSCFIPQGNFSVNFWCVLFSVFGAKKLFLIAAVLKAQRNATICFDLFRESERNVSSEQPKSSLHYR
jgi:hypothetical protein